MSEIGEIVDVRKQIEKITLEIIRLCGERVKLSRKIGEIKASKGMPVENMQVEQDLKDKVLKQCKTFGLNEKFCLKVLHVLVEESKQVQRDLTRSHRENV